MEPKIGTLTIKGFRAFRELKIEGLGRVNLITGRNNTGKSSLLEALRILASNGSPFVLADILHSREEDVVGAPEESVRPPIVDIMSSLTFFHGFPDFSPKIEPVSIATNGGSHPMRLSIEAVWLSEGRASDGSRILVPQIQELFEAGQRLLPSLKVTGDGFEFMTPLMAIHLSPIHWAQQFRSEQVTEGRMLCMFVNPYFGERTSTLGRLWDGIALSDSENDVVEALRIVDTTISKVSMVGGDKTPQGRTAIVRTTNLPHPVHLRSFGDGMNRLFGIALSLVNAKNGLLLIDEFENGMHHTVQLDIWRVIFKLARELDIQVFATSHSWDAIEAFQKAAGEVQDDEGVLIRLTRKGENIIPTVLRKDELAIVTRDHIEVR